MKDVGYVRSVLELLGIVILRFRPLQRVWGIWLVAANAACLYFINTIEGQVVLAVTGLAVALQAAVYQRIGFTRILGITHLMWLPMFVWMLTRIDVIRDDPALATWLLVLFATNVTCLVIDSIDTFRFLRGERAPHYRWDVPRPA